MAQDSAREGWAAPGWPKEHGGCDWSLAQRYIFDAELVAANAPPAIDFTFNMVGPMVIVFGTEAQKRRLLPPMLNGDIWWCQGFSEPNAGSDLASLKSHAERDGDHYVLNGSKLWTSFAHKANWLFGLFRTATLERRQQGISMFVLPMDTPGISVRPVRTIDGDYEVNQTYFDDVRVPVENLIGEEGKGWSIAKTALGWERLGIADVPRTKRALSRLKKIASAESRANPSMSSGSAGSAGRDFVDDIAQLELEMRSLELTEARFLFGGLDGDGAEASILKVHGSQVQQRISEMALEALAYYGHPDEEPVEGSNQEPVGPDYVPHTAAQYFNRRKYSIYGGTNEIQKNIVAKFVLGL